MTYLIFEKANTKPEAMRKEGEDKIINRSHTITLLPTCTPLPGRTRCVSPNTTMKVSVRLSRNASRDIQR